MASVNHADPVSPNKKFTSYIDYLKSIVDKRPEYLDVLDYFQSSFRENDIVQHLKDSVIIAESTGNQLKSQVLDAHWVPGTIERIIEQKNQLKNQEVQLIIVRSGYLRGSSRLLDFLGLEYDIDPAFFRAALSFGFFKHPFVFPEALPNPLSKFLVLPSRLLAHFAKSRNSQDQDISVMIILLYNTGDPYHWDQYHSWLFNNRPSIYTSSDSPMIRRGQARNYLPYYLKLLEEWHISEPEAFRINPSLYLGPMVKVIAQELQATTFRLRDRQRLRVYRTSFDNQQKIYSQGKILLEETAILSSQIDDFEHFSRQYRCLIEHKSQLQSTQYLELLRYIGEAIDDGTKVVRLIREQMQSEISLWSIEESKRSIEEATSVKRLTQLAFVFIPLSFVTSVFGMNVQEISGTGVKIWIFIVTAIVVGISLMMFLGLLKLVQTWWKKPGNSLRESMPTWRDIRAVFSKRERWRQLMDRQLRNLENLGLR